MPIDSGMDPIAWLRVPDTDELPEDLQTFFAKAEEKLGHVPNVFRAFSVTPRHFQLWFRYYDHLMRDEEASALSRAEREMIAVAVSSENRCEYCLASHGAYLRELEPDHRKTDLIAHNYRRADVSERERAILDFAVRMTTDAHTMSPADLEPLRAVGLGDEAIFEVAQVAAMFNFTNRLGNALGWRPNERYYTTQRP